MAVPPLTISPTIAPSSSTGADAHGQNQTFEFGAINNGGTPQSPIMKIAKEVAFAVAVALAARMVWERVIK